jgi:hypothetical protein
MTTAMNRHDRRKANAQERKFVRLSNGRKVKVTETINLSDPNLAPEHRTNFITLVKTRVAGLDELIASWYRHHDQCDIEGCDCGADELAEHASIMCSHLAFIKHRFGEVLIHGYPHFDRFVKEGLEPDEYETLTSSRGAITGLPTQTH